MRNPAERVALYFYVQAQKSHSYNSLTGKCLVVRTSGMRCVD